MEGPSPVTLLRLQEEELRHQNQQLQHSPREGANAFMVTSPLAGAASPRQNRNHPRNPSPDTEVIALSPKTIMAKNQFSCEVCNKGFQRDQNLQLHRRTHNIPSKLKKKTNHEVRQKIYVCPELGCVRHDPSRALGDLSAIKKHFSRKHGVKKFSCERCNKKYAVCSDWKAHNKICGSKQYKCDCGTTFSKHDSFISHRSFCDALGGEVAGHTINSLPYNNMDASILANSSNPASMSLGSAAGSSIRGSHQQFSYPLSVGSAFHPIQPPNMPLHPFSVPKLTYPRASDSSGIHGFTSYTTLGNMSNFDFNTGVALNSPRKDNSFTGLLMNTETSAYNIQKATMTGVNSNKVAHMNNMGSSLPGTTMMFNNYGGAWGDEMSGGGKFGCSTFQEMYNNLNVGGGSTRGYRSGGIEYASYQMNAPYGLMMYNVRNSDGRLVGEVNNNILVEPQMTVRSEYCDKLTWDFLDMENGMNNFTASGMKDDHNGYKIPIGNGTNSPDREATISADASPSFLHILPDF